MKNKIAKKRENLRTTLFVLGLLFMCFIFFFVGCGSKSGSTYILPVQDTITFNLQGRINLVSIETDILPSILPGNDPAVDYSNLKIEVYRQSTFNTRADELVREGQFGDVSRNGSYNIYFSGLPGNYYAKVVHPVRSLFALYLYLEGLSSSLITQNIDVYSTSIGIAVKIMKAKEIIVFPSEVEQEEIDVILPFVNQALISSSGNTEGIVDELQHEINIIPISNLYLSPTSLILGLGGSERLNATVQPQQEVRLTWETKNPLVATVDQTGLVTAVGIGNTVVTVSTPSKRFIASCVVEVNQTAQTTKVTGVSVDPVSLSLAQGEISTLVATIFPSNAYNKEVIWSSSAEGIASVNQSGVVRAIKKGSAVITATTVDGSFIATCQVMVSEPSKAVSSVELDRRVSEAILPDLTITISELAEPHSFFTTAFLTKLAGTETVEFYSYYEADFSQVVLLYDGLAFDILDDFSTIGFSTPLPIGAKVQVFKDGGARTLVATGYVR